MSLMLFASVSNWVFNVVFLFLLRWKLHFLALNSCYLGSVYHKTLVSVILNSFCWVGHFPKIRSNRQAVTMIMRWMALMARMYLLLWRHPGLNPGQEVRSSGWPILLKWHAEFRTCCIIIYLMGNLVIIHKGLCYFTRKLQKMETFLTCSTFDVQLNALLKNKVMLLHTGIHCRPRL